MEEPYMPHGWMHALVRRRDEPHDVDASYGTVVDAMDAKVKVRWADGATSWEPKRDLDGRSG